MFRLVILAMVLSPASALQVDRPKKKAHDKTEVVTPKPTPVEDNFDPSEPTLPTNNYAYVTVWMREDKLPKGTRLADKMSEQEEEDYKKDHEEYKASRPGMKLDLVDVPFKFDLADKSNSESTTDMDLESGLPGNGKNKYGPKSLFRIDDQLRQVGSTYPYVIVTNDPAMINSPELANHPNIVILKVGDEADKDVQLIRLRAKVMSRNAMHIQKMSIFKLEQYQRLISLDMDITIHKNLDHIFEEYDTQDGTQIYGILNDFECVGEREFVAASKFGKGDYFNSAVMLIEPKKWVFDDMVAYTKKRGGFYGDQTITQRYFQHKKKAPKLFPTKVADFSGCHPYNKKLKASQQQPLEVAHHR